ncbi:hypothetical protein [Variovorax gossypii]
MNTMSLKVWHVLAAFVASFALVAFFFSWQMWRGQPLTADAIAAAPKGCVQDAVKNQIRTRSSPVTYAGLEGITTVCAEQLARDKQLEAVTSGAATSRGRE